MKAQNKYSSLLLKALMCPIKKSTKPFFIGLYFFNSLDKNSLCFVKNG